MALKKRSYKKSEIEKMDINNIPKNFIDYIMQQEFEIQKALLESRKDIADVLGLCFDASVQQIPIYNDIIRNDENMDNELPSADKFDKAEEIKVSENKILKFDDNEEIVEISANTNELFDDLEEESEEELEETEEVFEDIENIGEFDFDVTDFIYEEDQLAVGKQKAVNPINVFSIKNNHTECETHRCKFKRFQLKYNTFGMFVYYCPKCKFIYKEIDSVEGFKKKLEESGITLNYVNLEDTNRYLLSHMDPIELGGDTVLYYEDTWISENPVCSIHNKTLKVYPYRISYKDRYADFYAHYCENCDKIIVRKAKVNKLIDLFSKMKVPAPDFELHQEKLSKKAVVKPKIIAAEYYIDNGRKVSYSGNQKDCYQLQETDTIVVSDTRLCNKSNHNTEDILISVKVKPKRKTLTAFLCVAGYCTECEKYYMSVVDYDVLYKAGRPEVTVIDDTENEDYHITSGEVFDKERQHLKDFENDIDRYEKNIKAQPDYVSPFKKGGWLTLKVAKSISVAKYDPILNALSVIEPKPYKYHVNLSYKGQKIPFYVGVLNVYARKAGDYTELRVSDTSDQARDGEVQVVYSYNDRNFGGQLVNYRTIDVNYKNEKCDITLIRELDIEEAELYGYTNIRTNSDLVFRSGVTDPFLIKVLKNRRREHKPDDIYTTIQENQNAIIDEPLQQNIIVQGCAGSGKTMVLLHRLSAMKYNHPEYDFSNVIILTPNENFNLHIKGVADSMQIGGILRESVEQYYIDVLMRYDKKFKPPHKIGNEMKNGVSQNFVDFIYSDMFIKWFECSYDKVLKQRNDFCSKIKCFADIFGVAPKDVDLNKNEVVFEQYKTELQRFSTYIREKEYIYEENVKKLENKEKRNKFLEEKIKTLNEEIIKIVKSMNSSVNGKISSRITEIKKLLRENKIKIEILKKELEQIEKSGNTSENSVKIKDKKKAIHTFEVNIETNNQLLQNIAKLIQQRKDTQMKFDDFFIWVKEISLYVPDVKNDVHLFNTVYREYFKFKHENKELVAELVEVRKNVEDCKKACYSEDIKKKLSEYENELKEYDVIPIFEKIFADATEEFIKLNHINPNKTVRRYTLYAQTLFAEKFYAREDSGYSMFYIDEGQDLSINEYRLIRRLNGEKTIFNIFGDTNQLLKPNRGIADWSILIDELGTKQFTLNENYRNTNQITKFCNHSFNMEVLQTGVDGSKVVEIDRSELEQQLNELSIDGERVAILVPRKVARRTFKDEKNLEKKGAGYKKGYLDYQLLSDKTKELIDDTLSDKKIAYMYVDEVKGVEFDKVFVIANGMTDNEKYIAYTRALSDLILVVDDNIQPPKLHKKVKLPMEEGYMHE